MLPLSVRRCLFVAYYSSSLHAAPRGVILTDFLISFTGLAVIRLFFRLVRERYLSPQSRLTRSARRVGIVGAGDVGANLAHDLMAEEASGWCRSLSLTMTAASGGLEFMISRSSAPPKPCSIKT